MRRNYFTTFLIFCFLISVSSIKGQNQKRFRHITIDEGLAHTDALCFAQDDKGFMWIGTNSGLHRYDGNELLHYFNRLSTINQVYNNRITSLVLQDQYLWTGTEGGLSCFSLLDEKFISIEYNDASGKSFLSKIDQVELIDGKIWFIAESNLYIAEFDSAKKELNVSEFDGSGLLDNNNYKSIEVASISSDSRGNVFIGTNNGFVIYNINSNKANHIAEYSDGAGSNNFNVSYCYYSSGNIWLLTDNSLVIYPFMNFKSFTGGVGKSLTYSKLFNLAGSNSVHPLNSIFIDSLGGLWGSSPGGLLFMNDPLTMDPDVQLYKRSPVDKYSLSTNHIATIFKDRSQCLWIGTWGGGVNILDLNQKKFNLALPDPDNLEDFFLAQPFIRAITEDDNNLIWIGLKNDGIRIFNPETGELTAQYRNTEINSKLSNKDIHSLAAIDGAVIIGTMQGLNIFDLESGNVYQYLHDPLNPRTIASKEIYSLSVDAYGAIWMGTWGGGLNRIFLDDDFNIVSVDHFIAHQGAHKIGSNTVTFLRFDEEKNEMLISTSHGLSRFILDKKGDIARSFIYRGVDGPNSLSSEYIWSIVKENDSTYWLGTLGGGLNRIVFTDSTEKDRRAKYKATQYGVDNGMIGNDVESLLRDDKGNFWIGGLGLSKFNPDDQEFWTFDANDGLQSRGFKIGAAFKASDGRMYFGGINGLNYFYPEDITKNKIKPKPVISRLKIHDKVIVPGEEINGRILIEKSVVYLNTLELEHSENDFSLSFSATHYANPDKCRFRYKFDEKDENWTYLTADYPVVSFSNLDYGAYTLKVQAANHDGIWGDETLAVDIKISPPWWKSKYAYIMYLILYFSIALAIYYYIAKLATVRNNLKLSKAQEQKNEELMQLKLKFFTNISHEFKTPLSLIMVPVERLITENLKAVEQQKLIKVVYKNSKRLYYLVNELIDFRKAEAGELKLHKRKLDVNEFVKNIVETFQDSDRNRENSLHFNGSINEALWFDPDKMSNIVYNLISNAIKFSDGNTDIYIDLFSGTFDSIKPSYINTYEENNFDKDTEYVFLRVKDEGVGISESSISKVFLRFYQISDPGRSHLGSGIGLALIRSLVLLHKGVILVSSERNKGSEFIVGFPVDVGSDLEDDNEDSYDFDINLSDMKEIIELDKGNSVDRTHNLNAKSEKPNLLIVEDNEELRNLLRDTFSNEFHVTDAPNGQEALLLMQKRIPDMVISDLIMPVMDGLEFLEKLRDNINTSHIPVIILTAKNSVESQIDGVEKGADLYIPKPFSLRLLKAQVKKLIQSRVQLRDKYSQDAFSDCRDLARNTRDRDFLNQFIQMVDSELENKDFSVEHLTKELGIGRTNLYRKIKSLTGQSMGDFIREIRLKKAASILVTEDVSISEVIYRVGLNSNSYFTKAFKQKFGMTPSEFIQKNRK